jgi:hypothetical protein
VFDDLLDPRSALINNTLLSAAAIVSSTAGDRHGLGRSNIW